MKVKGCDKGFTMLELVIASIIIMIIVRAGLVFHVPLRQNLVQLEARFTAINIASSQIEDLQELGKEDNIWDGTIPSPPADALLTTCLADADPHTGKFQTLSLAGINWDHIYFIDPPGNPAYLQYDLIDDEFTAGNAWDSDGAGAGDTDYKIVRVICRYDIPTAATGNMGGSIELLGFIITPDTTE